MGIYVTPQEAVALGLCSLKAENRKMEYSRAERLGARREIREIIQRARARREDHSGEVVAVSTAYGDVRARFVEDPFGNTTTIPLGGHQ